MKLHYCYDKSGKYTGAKPSRLSPLDKDEVYLLPKDATFISPPEVDETTKAPYFNKEEKKWEIKIDPTYELHLKEIERKEKELEEQRIIDKLKKVNEYGVKIYKRVGNEVVEKTEAELLRDKINNIKYRLGPKYTGLKSKFIELSAICYVNNNLYAKDKLKEFKDKIEEIWNSIDGTKKPEEIIWPEPPEL